MSRSATRTSALAILFASATAHAQPASVDVSDLPPLPAASDEDRSAATRFAAGEAEEDVVVGAAKREQSLGNVASAVTVVSGDRLRRFGYRTIGEAVAAVAGVYLVDNRLSYSIGIRGLQIPGDFNTRVLVLVDGATINEVWGAFAGLGFDAIVGIDEVARIEVIRGPVSSVYGTNAFFGIINIVTLNAADQARAWARSGVNSINGVVSGAGFSAGGLDRQVRGSVSFMDRIGETNLVLPDGTAASKGDGSTAYTVGLVGSYGGTFGQLRASRFNRESPFGPYDVPSTGPAYDQVDRHLLVEGGHSFALSKRLGAAVRGYSNLYKFSDNSPPFDPAMGDLPLDTTGTARTIGAEVRGRYEIVVPDKLGITAGTEVSNNRTQSTAFEAPTPNDLIANTISRFNLIGAYTELDGQPLPWLGFTGGVRVDIHSQLQDKVSPRAALFVASPEHYGAKLLYAEGFRNPSGFEAFFQDGSDFVAHPEDLRAEAIRSFEVVGWLKQGGLSARLSGFHWSATGIIESQPAPEDPTKQQFQNATRYVTRGAEVEASYRNSRGWYLFGGGALTDVGIEEMGSVVYGGVTNAPKYTAGAGASTPKLGGKAHVSLEGIVIGSRPTRPDVDGNRSPDAPAWLGLNLTIYAPHVFKGFDATAGARNLIGKRDLVPTPGDYDRSRPTDLVIPRVPGEGREIYVKLGYSY